ncbi:non-ribosomal peptide synthetase [Actinomadura violacea]|uniref:Amino acid adenylation domain-containing protein n=1 Tax=Actinomadura violacea TaxID=2819934 RepID=A0ABS3RNW8_9ACTN|nr:non-ribosomal peptide synthetase [Actinomadura violacea]MBO2458316.1 amino acid adenylation domain-containing protein [Actinomadura violacea]
MISLARLFVRQATRTPRATALVGGEESVTYAELDRRSAALAAHLRAHGVRAEARVAVHLPRGVDLVVALLAVWRAGGAYVPLDPAHPDRRKADTLRDTAPVAVVTSRDPRHRLAASLAAGAAIVHPGDAPDGPPARRPDTGPDLDPDSAAYVLHTSGSTGRPKGVEITHGGIANRVMWTVGRHRLGPADRVLHKTAVTFDAAGWEMFAPLVSGGAVVLAPPGAERDPARLLRVVAAHQVTVLQVVPSLLRLLVREDWSGCGSLRLLFSAGEPLDAETCRRLLERHRCEIWNTYGPTECSIDVTAHPVGADVPSGPVPIGRPIDRTWLRVLDEAGEPVPVGVPGELYAGGAGLARGYAGRPDLTADRFVPDPYGPPGARLYRTGDLVMWRPDGDLRYLGRVDRQLKVNGVRIEPAEVETALTAHPDVACAAVDVRGGRLVGYVVPAAHDASGRATAAAELRAHLADLLPSPMVPSAFVTLPGLPLTTSGKLDREALPDPSREPGRAGPPGDAAPSPAERVVAEVWAGLLDTGMPGRHDDFFQLGGHSLLLARLAADLRERSGAPVDVAALYGAATVGQQALLLDPAGTGRLGPPAADQAVRPVPRGGPLPASHGQRRMWFLDRMNPGGAEYVVPLALRIDAPPAELDRALTVLAARHEALRTRLRLDGTEVVQVIDEPGPVRARIVDTVPGDLSDQVTAEVGRGFDLENGPVWRAMHLRTAEDPPLLLLTFHHAACDGASLLVIERELRALCSANHGARDLPDEAGRLDQADYAAWQRRRAELRAPGDLPYWRAELADDDPFELPADRPRPPRRDTAGAVVRWTLPARRAEAFAEVGRAHGATPYVALLAAFGCLLARYGTTRHVTVGSPVSDRDRPEFRDVVGFLSETLVHRLDLSGDPSFREVLERVGASVRADFAHRHVPFERLVEELRPDPDPSRTPLFQIMFDLQEDGVSGPAEDPAFAGLLDRAWRVARSDLGLTVRRAADGTLTGRFEYATALFDAATVRRLADRFVRLLGDLAAQPDASAADLAAPAADERRALLARAAGPRAPGLRPGRPPQRVWELVEERARRAPEAVALVQGDRQVTYAELDARADAVARRLRLAGVGADTVVGLPARRGPEFVARVLGVWKAGGGYLPLNTAEAPDRARRMVRDSGASLILADAGQDLGDAVPAGVPVLRDDPAADEEAQAAGEDVRTEGTGEELAYVIFTSGSTGPPKGVQVEQRSLANLVLATRDDFARGEQDVWLAPAAPSFDISLVELWVPLVSGARVVLPFDGEAADPAAQLRLIAEHGVTHLQLTPAGWRMLLAAGLGRVPMVAQVGGESCDPALLAELTAAVDRLHNVYGPTEGTVRTTGWPVPARPGRVSLGSPMAGTTVHVLDERLRPVPFGAVGEICLGGAGVARGYAGRPAATAGRFLPDPYAAEPGARLYRTGDLAVRHRDGTLEFAGRADGQLKIRGHRIEPAEVEAALTAVPDVRDARVVAHGDGDDRLLVAYCATGPAGLPGHDALTAACARVLPAALIPAAFVALDRLPLTTHGKVDRRALPAFDPRGGAAAAPSRPPAEGAERRIAGLWAGLLGAEPGADDDFFRLGGTSMLAARAVAAVGRAFGLALPLSVLYERPTVAALAAEVAARLRAEIVALPAAEVAALVDPAASATTIQETQP